MYHPSRGGVRGGRDQFKWDDVKVDKHRENYLGHSIMAPVGRWQKGKDLHWYTRDKKAAALNSEVAKEEIRRIKEEEEQLMHEALGLAPKRTIHARGNRIDKHEYAELIKRGSAAEDLGGGHAEAAQVQGLGLYKLPKNREEASSSLQEGFKEMSPERDVEPIMTKPTTRNIEEDSRDDKLRTKRRQREEKREDKERRWEKHDSKRSRDNDYDKCRHRREEKRRHGS